MAESSDLAYCDNCYSCKDCIGCVGLNKKRYCILNRQYSKEEYETLAATIIKQLRETGEWGKFFPVDCRRSPTMKRWLGSTFR